MAYVGSLFKLKFSLHETTICVLLCTFPSARRIWLPFAQIFSLENSILCKKQAILSAIHLTGNYSTYYENSKQRSCYKKPRSWSEPRTRITQAPSWNLARKTKPKCSSRDYSFPSNQSLQFHRDCRLVDDGRSCAKQFWGPISRDKRSDRAKCLRGWVVVS